jgi:hypothetical protein
MVTFASTDDTCVEHWPERVQDPQEAFRDVKGN